MGTSVPSSAPTQANSHAPLLTSTCHPAGPDIALNNNHQILQADACDVGVGAPPPPTNSSDEVSNLLKSSCSIMSCPKHQPLAHSWPAHCRRPSILNLRNTAVGHQSLISETGPQPRSRPTRTHSCRALPEPRTTLQTAIVRGCSHVVCTQRLRQACRGGEGVRRQHSPIVSQNASSGFASTVVHRSSAGSRKARSNTIEREGTQWISQM